jgi:UDP-glucose:(heptosyl)LPS alpha-1,3-glucosyltransferase
MFAGKRLRIAVLSRHFVRTGGGAERYAIALVEQIAAQHEVHVFAQHIDHQWQGVTYHRLGFHLRRPRWINQLGFSLATWWATRKGFDVVHSHENVWHGNLQTVHVLPVRHSLFFGKAGLALAKSYLRVATSLRLMSYLWLEKCRFNPIPGRRVVAVSEALRQSMLQAFPGVRPALDVVTPGVALPSAATTPEVRLAARQRLGLPDQGSCLLFVGNDIRKKGLPTLLQALAKLPATVSLAVVSRAGQREAVAALASASGVAQRVFFLGSQQDMQAAYCACDILVHPTLQDAYGMVVLEAFAYGLPVVVSALPYCGIASDLRHLQHAWLLGQPGDALALQDAVATLLADPTLAQQLGQQGAAFARAHAWPQVALHHQQIFEAIVAESGP